MKQAVCALITSVEVPTWFLVVSRPNDESLWGMPGGKVDPGETPLQAIVRELWEEIGIAVDPKNLEPIHTSVCSGETDYETTTFWYTGPGIWSSECTLEPGLHKGYCTEEELCSFEFSPFAEYNQRMFNDLNKELAL